MNDTQRTTIGRTAPAYFLGRPARVYVERYRAQALARAARSTHTRLPLAA